MNRDSALQEHRGDRPVATPVVAAVFDAARRGFYRIAARLAEKLTPA
ncbi:MAG TPA: hypothetical protein VN153_11895 [Tahibacter sp.]|nr:hypothetical protein [Tahibacter sp.]